MGRCMSGKRPSLSGEACTARLLTMATRSAERTGVSRGHSYWSKGRLKQQIRQLTHPSGSLSMPERTHRVNQYVMGWIGCFRLVETPSVLQMTEGWIRRRFRLYQWLQWKRIRTRIRELRALGLKETVMEGERLCNILTIHVAAFTMNMYICPYTRQSPRRPVKNGCDASISGISPKKKAVPQGFSNGKTSGIRSILHEITSPLGPLEKVNRFRAAKAAWETPSKTTEPMR